MPKTIYTTWATTKEEISVWANLYEQKLKKEEHDGVQNIDTILKDTWMIVYLSIYLRGLIKKILVWTKQSIDDDE